MTHASEVLTDLVADMARTEADAADDSSENAATQAAAKGKGVRPDGPPFASNVQGRLLRHAATGIYYPHRAGSAQERLYFKVCDASRSTKSESDYYYYDSPSDYTRQTGNEVADSVRRGWEERRLGLA